MFLKPDEATCRPHSITLNFDTLHKINPAAWGATTGLEILR